MLGTVALHISIVSHLQDAVAYNQVRIQRGGAGGPEPPGKLQVIWVSRGNKQ